MKKTLLTIIIFLSFALQVVNVQGNDLTDEQARRVAIDAIKTKLKESFVTVHRKEDVEDSYFNEQDYPKTGIVNILYFFEASRDGREIRDGKISLHIVTDGGGPIGTVAVARNTGKVYFLYGFKDNETQFRELIHDFPIRIGKDSATYWVETYMELVNGGYNNVLIQSEHGLKSMVESNYCAAYWCSKNRNKAERQAERWWSAFKHSGLIEKLDSSMEKEQGFFSVTFKRFRPMAWSWFDPIFKGDPFVTDWIVRVYPDGRVEEFSERVIFTIDEKNIGRDISGAKGEAKK